MAEETQLQEDVKGYFISVADIFKKKEKKKKRDVYNVIFKVLNLWDVCFGVMSLI